MLNCLSVTLSPLLFEDEFHFPFCVLYHRGLHLDFICWYDRVSTDDVFTGPNFVNLVKGEYVSDFDVAQVRDRKQVSWCQNIFCACKRGDDVLRWLRANELESGTSRVWDD